MDIHDKELKEELEYDGVFDLGMARVRNGGVLKEWSVNILLALQFGCSIKTFFCKFRSDSFWSCVMEP